jgi:hypothetical protein
LAMRARACPWKIAQKMKSSQGIRYENFHRNTSLYKYSFE